MSRSRTLTEARDEFVVHSRSKGLAPATVKAYEVTLGQFARCVRDIQVWRVEGHHVDRYFTAYDWSPATRNGKVAQLTTFFRFCRARGYTRGDRDPMFGYKRVAPPEVDRLRVPRAEWGRLLDACQTPKESVVIASGLYLFLRASEQQGLRVKHVHLSESEVDIYRRKTKRWDRMPITAELEPYLRAHLEWYSSRVALNPEHYLIPGGTPPRRRESNGRLIAGTGDIDPTRPFAKPHQIVQRVLARAGYPSEWEGEHTLRRSGARAYFDHLVSVGYDGALRRVQSMLGHKNSAMTEVYLGLSLDRLARNEDLRGKPMFPVADMTNVLELRRDSWLVEK